MSQAGPPPAPVPVILRQDGGLEDLVGLFRTLSDGGMAPRAAQAAIERLVATGRAHCDIPGHMNFRWLEWSLGLLGIRLYRRRAYADAAALLRDARRRADLSPDEFAVVLGVDAAALRQWEDGIGRPGLTLLHLVRLYDSAPDLFDTIAYELVVPPP